MIPVGVDQQKEDALAALQQRWHGLSKLERGEGLKSLVELRFSKQELARKFNCSESLVRQLIKLAELPATLLEEYEAGEIGRKQALQRAKELQQAKPPRVKRQTRIKRGARALEEWVRTEVPSYACEGFFREVMHETEGPQGWQFKLVARPAKLEDQYANPADLIAECRPVDPAPTYGPDLINWLVGWYARWIQRLLPDRADREEALRLVMARLVPQM